MPIVKKERGGSTRSKRSESNGQSEDLAGIHLPTHKNEPPKTLLEHIILIYGAKGVGKSSLLAEIEDSVNFQMERGRRNLPIMMIPDRKAGEPELTFARLIKYQEKYLSLPEKSRPACVHFDTADALYVLAREYQCRQRGITDHGAFEHQDWDAVDSLILGLCEAYRDNGVIVTFLSHAKQRELEVEDSQSAYNQTSPSCTPRMFKFLKMYTDFAFYYGYKEAQRVIFVRGTESLWIGNARSTDCFLDCEDGHPLRCVPAGEGPEQAWKNLNLAFQNKLRDPFEEEEDEEDEPDNSDIEVSKFKRKKK